LEAWVRWVVASIGALVIAAELVLMVLAPVGALSGSTAADSVVTLLCGLALVCILAGPAPVAVASVVVAGIAVPLPTYVLLLLALPGLAFLCARYLRWRLLVVVSLGHAAAVIVAALMRVDAWAVLVVGLAGLLLGLVTGGATRVLSVRLLRAAQERERVVIASRRAVARDLHDVIAQNLAVIALHAEAMPLQPEDQRQATLALLARRARETHRDLRGLLDVLYEQTGFRTEDLIQGPAATSGVLTVERSVESVAHELREDGFTVTLRCRWGDLTDVPTSVHAAMHRIAQEASANVRHHAQPGTDVEITADQDGESLRLGMVNVLAEGLGGPAAAGRAGPTTPGYGLTNMRERASLLGGRAEFSGDGGRWSVCVTLPTGLR
ncbi:MAG: histidine kinase, partial [Propionibacteriaceae bacterium]|nr:histidine kinase [Propionibacteriaceae bacterium]